MKVLINLFIYLFSILFFRMSVGRRLSVAAKESRGGDGGSGKESGGKTSATNDVRARWRRRKRRRGLEAEADVEGRRKVNDTA